MTKITEPMTIYEMCITKAKESPCQKRGFGCVLFMYGSVFTCTNNHPIDPASHLCDPECIRFKINSGTDSLIGACGHAEEHAIWEAINEYGTAEGAILYVAGVEKPDNTPLAKGNKSFYCVRCATLMHYAKVHGVNVWVDGKWEFLSADEAYQSSLNYSLRKVVLEKGES